MLGEDFTTHDNSKKKSYFHSILHRSGVQKNKFLNENHENSKYQKTNISMAFIFKLSIFNSHSSIP